MKPLGSLPLKNWISYAECCIIFRKSMPKIAFATYQQLPGVTDDDRLVADVLSQRGVSVQAAPWDAKDVDWSSFDRVIIRSTWDYSLKREAYERWVGGFLTAPHRFWNPPDAVLANLSKRYLLEFAARGADVIPTVYVAVGETPRLQIIMEKQGWREIVIKPAVSAAARGTWRTSIERTDADQDRFAEQAKAEPMLIQPYFPEIAARGEWSLIFFGGHFSHAVLKKPATGDFRVQKHLGGTTVSAAPHSRLVDQALQILQIFKTPLLYARLDGIERDGRFVLMELEINEPFLFLGYSPEAPARFADAIMAILKP